MNQTQKNPLNNFQLIIMCGLPGSGKSTLARRLSKGLGAQYLSSDVMRKKMFNNNHFEIRPDIEMIKVNAHAKLHQEVCDQLKMREKVILDATNVNIEERRIYLQKFTQVCASEKICFVMMKTDPEVIKKRMKKHEDANSEAQENFYESWQIVFGEFEDEFAQGISGWPDEDPELDQQIKFFNYEQLKPYLDQTD